jgi:hypothetical protein
MLFVLFLLIFSYRIFLLFSKSIASRNSDGEENSAHLVAEALGATAVPAVPNGSNCGDGVHPERLGEAKPSSSTS